MDYDLVQELHGKIKELEYAVKQLQTSGKNFAEAERNYKVALREECLLLRDSGMAIGMIDKTCYGIPRVAELRFKRDIAEVVYKANMETINSFKLQIRLLDNQISREWVTPISN